MAAGQQLLLVEPDDRYAAAFLDLAEEFHRAGETRFDRDLPLICANFKAYVEGIRRIARGERLAQGIVPYDEFWLLDYSAGKILGVIRLRRYLTPHLEERYGHIGYAIRPGERRKGYGSLMLALLLDCLRDPAWQQSRGLDLRRVLVTCDTCNVGSARIIEGNGGVLENRVWSGGVLISRYWIHLEAGNDGGETHAGG